MTDLNVKVEHSPKQWRGQCSSQFLQQAYGYLPSFRAS